MKRLIGIFTLALALTMGTSFAAYAVSYDNEQIQVVDTVPVLKVVSGGVRIGLADDESRTFYFYSITGQLVKSVTVDETCVVDLPQGCYIVKCADWSKKIVVK